MFGSLLICPVCKKGLIFDGCALRCESGHSFDVASEGYVNLLLGNKPGENIGDSRQMARSRSAFLNAGYYRSLSDKIGSIVAKEAPATILDVCCGEGYYFSHLCGITGASVYAFDISKEMVRLAAKRRCDATVFVANMTDIPVLSSSFDCAVHMFAPLYPKELLRVVRTGGILIDVSPGARHLWELKSIIYDEPYMNEEKSVEIPGFVMEREDRLEGKIEFHANSDIQALFRMTPYYYHSSGSDRRKLDEYSSLETKTDFLIRIYRRNNDEA